MRLTLRHQPTDPGYNSKHHLMLGSAAVGLLTKNKTHREHPWFAWNRIETRPVGRYRTLREARGALEEAIRESVKRLAQEVE